MEPMTYLKLKINANDGDVVIRYKDFVVVAIFNPDFDGCFTVKAYATVDDPDEVDFSNCRLENVTEWEGDRFDTEGEALMAAFLALDQTGGLY